MSSLRKKSAIEVRLEEGDEYGLAKLFTKHQARLWRMIEFRMDRRLVGRVDADDILQEGYLAARQRISHFKDTDMSPFIWFRTILAQTLIDVTRRHLGAQMRSVEREFSMNQQDAGQTTSLCLADRLAGSDTSPSQVAVRNETVQHIEKAIAQMDPIDQEVLALRHFEDLTNLEVAESLGIQQKAASIRYMRALKRLKEVLASTQGFTEEFRGNSS
jgi:RNA polymerase sigma-70 factor (ECF subfamily)